MNIDTLSIARDLKASELPEMARGKGVRLQKYKDGGIADARIFYAKDGLSWSDSSNRTFVKPMSELKEWVGERAQAGRQPPLPRQGGGKRRRRSNPSAGTGGATA